MPGIERKGAPETRESRASAEGGIEQKKKISRKKEGTLRCINNKSARSYVISEEDPYIEKRKAAKSRTGGSRVRISRGGGGFLKLEKKKKKPQKKRVRCRGEE